MRRNLWDARGSIQNGFTLVEVMVALVIALTTGLMTVSVMKLSTDAQTKMENGMELGEEQNSIAAVLANDRIKDPIVCSQRFQLTSNGFQNALPTVITAEKVSELKITDFSGRVFEKDSLLGTKSKLSIEALNLVIPPQSGVVNGSQTSFAGRIELQAKEKNSNGQWQSQPKKVLGMISLTTNASGTQISSCSSSEAQLTCNRVGGVINTITQVCEIPNRCKAGSIEVVRSTSVPSVGIKTYVSCETPKELIKRIPASVSTGCDNPNTIKVSGTSGPECITIGQYIAQRCPVKGTTLVPDGVGGSVCKSINNLLGLSCNDDKFMVKNNADSNCKNIYEYVPAAAVAAPTGQPMNCDINGPGFYTFGSLTGSCRGAIGDTNCQIPANLGSAGALSFCGGAQATRFRCSGSGFTAYDFTVCNAAPIPVASIPSVPTTTSPQPAPSSASCSVMGPGVYGSGSSPNCKEYTDSQSCIPGANTSVTPEGTCASGLATNYTCGSQYQFKVCEPVAPLPPTVYPDICVDIDIFGFGFQNICYPDPRNIPATVTTSTLPQANVAQCRTYYQLPSNKICLDQEINDEDGDGICGECREEVLQRTYNRMYDLENLNFQFRFQ